MTVNTLLPTTPLRYGLLATLLWVVTACASALGKPDWIDNPDKQYPDVQYLTGIGEGDDRESAAAAATAALSAIFESDVDAETRVRESLQQGPEGSVLNSLTDIDVVIRSALKLEGVQIAERWEDRSGRHFALALLDRDEASADLADRMRSQENAIRTKIEFAGSLPTPFEQARALIPVAALAVERDVWAAQYRVLGDRNWSASPSTAAIENRIDTAMNSASFTVDARILEDETGREKNNATFARTLGDVVNEAGFRVSRNAGGNVLISSLITLSEPFERGNNDWIHYLWDVSIEVSANESNARAFLVVEDSGSTSNPNGSTAKRGAIQQAEASILRRFDTEFSRFMNETE